MTHLILKIDFHLVFFYSQNSIKKLNYETENKTTLQKFS